MAKIKPYTFGSDFDAPTQAKSVKPPEPTFSKAELEAARQGGISEGRAAATAEAQHAREQRTTAALTRIAKEINEIKARSALTGLAAEQFAMSVAEVLIGKAFPELAKRNGQQEILAFFQTCLQEARGEPRLVVRVNDAVLDPLRPLLDQAAQQCGFDGKIVMLPEASLGEADCRIEWADGGGERELSEILKAATDAFDRFLDRPVPASTEPIEGPAAGAGGAA